MKNFLKIVLAAALILSMTACGNGTQIENNDPEDIQGEEISDITENETPDTPDPVTPEEPENPEPENPEPENPEPENPEPENPEPEVPEVPEFDSTWAGDNYIMPVPQPPYPVNVTIRDGSFVITSSSAAEVKEGTIEDIINYCETLQKIGYNIGIKSETLKGFTEDRPGYNFFAENADGNFLEVIYDGNGLMMFVKGNEVSEEEPPAETPAFDTAWASNNYEKLIPKPPFEGWTGKMKDTNVYELFTSEAKTGDSLSYYDVWQNYLDLLESLGFSVEGEVYSSTAHDPMGNEFKLKCGDGCAWITFSPVENLG